MANFAATDKNLPDTLDYLLSGYNSLGNEFEGKSSGTFAYIDGSGPETTQTQPNNPPFSNIASGYYYVTDMFIPITITDARQRVVVGMSLTAQIGVYSDDNSTFPPSPGGYPATGDFYISLNRIPAQYLERGYQTLAWLEPYTIQEVMIPFSAPAADVVDGYPLTVGTAGCVFTNIVDQPGEPGDYFYWQGIFWLNTSPSPNRLEVQWFELRNRSIGASMVKP